MMTEQPEPGPRSKPNLSERDLVLGKRVIRFMTVGCLAALVVNLAIAVYVFQSVPLDTRLPYSGRFGRNGIPMPIAMGVFVVFLALFARPYGSKAHHMGKRARVILYILAVAIMVVAVWAQWELAKAILVEGGARG
ncbi:hypothetical protein BN1051_00110 [Arthrobacter saudimassiliensis]|uniref:Uncharacterized protein n=1 Tax=Arthrobacter saudimassiliensis TaxID=1461584 RepID=A0A078MKG5_9MICC|nr:hypothetical protein BN1051_00110 [Arthrobacter saudimassiliensis]